MLYKRILAFTAILARFLHDWIRCFRKIVTASPDPNQFFVELAVVLWRVGFADAKIAEQTSASLQSDVD